MQEPIESQWEVYCQLILRPGLPDHVMRALKQAFFGGATAFWILQKDAGTADGMAELFRIVGDEVEAYARGECERRGCNCNRKHRVN